MAAPSKELKKWFSEQIHLAVSKNYPQANITLEQVGNSISKPKREYGDLSCSVCLRISKVLGKKPADVAAVIMKDIKKDKLILEVKEVAGYINAVVNEKEYAKIVFDEIERGADKYGSSSAGKREKALVEYPAVNPNKPWHIGHLRNALLGDSISNILDFCGYEVEREDYIDDLGLQIAESLWGYMKLGGKPDKKFDEWLGEQYVEVNKIMKEKKLETEIGEMLKKMESGDGEIAKLAREVSAKCVDAQYETAYSYGIYHDVMIWESDIVKARLLEKALDIAIRSGALSKQTSGKNAGCIVMDLEKVRGFAKDFENPEEKEKVIVRSDGTATYVAKDIAFHLWKLGIIKSDFKYEMLGTHGKRELWSTRSTGAKQGFGNAKIVVNVIGSAQRYPQLILKAVIGLMGYEEQSRSIVHVAYGEVSVEGGSLSGRKGGWMGGDEKAFTADSLLRESVGKALEATQGSSKISDKSKIQEIAQAIGSSAIRFEFLRISPAKPVVFSWKTALNFEGNSGPYCMYTYARANRILEKAGYKRAKISQANLSGLERGQDFELLKLLGEAQEVVERAAAEYSPNAITDYLVELTSAFSKFYESMPVMNSGDAQEVRMRLLDAYMQVVKNMFGLVGLSALESM
jgi:arginyl-tRNA synthetase